MPITLDGTNGIITPSQTSTGDIKLSGAINAANSVGTDGQVLTSNGTSSYWSEPAGFEQSFLLMGA